MIALYFKSRERLSDKSTWSKEELPEDYTVSEVAHVAHIAGMEGYAIIDENNKPIVFKWFKK